MRPPIRLISGLSVLALAGLVAGPSSAPADVVYMKDGFTMHGKVRHEADLIVDPATGAMIPIVKSGSYFLMDDRVRLVIFNHRSVETADPEVNIRSEFISLMHPIQTFAQDGRLPKKAIVLDTSPIDDKWNRTLKLAAFNTGNPNEPDKMVIQQRLRSLSPYAVMVHSQRYPWAMSYLTRELGEDLLIKLLDTHADTAEGDAPDADRRLKRIRFLLQAGRLAAADRELDRATNDLPKDNKDVTDRLDRVRVLIRQAQVREKWETIQTAHKAGRHEDVKPLLGVLAVDQLDSRVGAEATTLKEKYATWDRQAKDLNRLLNLVNASFVGPPDPDGPESTIRTGASPDTFDRLEPFLTIAAQYEKELQTGKQPTYAAEDIFALAVTGWVMGRESAEPKAATAERFWDSLKFLLAYQRAHDAGSRTRLFDEYQNHSPLTLDEITQMIALSPPPDPAVPGPTVATGVEQRQTQVPWTLNRPVSYLLQMPPEYRPTRPYPVLIALHGGGGDNPMTAMRQWAVEAARNGYILVAPDWGGAMGYTYSEAEHTVVTELIKDLRRRYAVDSDRVFLAGYGEGASMAFDVGLSHPDLFAGIVPVNGRPRRTVMASYSRNAQYLPFYVVCGEMAGGAPNMVNWVSDTRETHEHQRTAILDRFPVEQWMNRGYPTLMTIYKGRATEFYTAEVPTIFDWMNRKRRASGFPELGRNPNSGGQSEEFQSMRVGDNHFYWVSIEQINEKNVNPAIGMKSGAPAAIQASVRDGNSIFVSTRGVKSLRLWFGRIWDAQSGWRPMVDFAKPVRVTVNGRVAGGREKAIQPSLRTMLDDLYQRGDRQRMFLAYVDLTGLQ